MKKQIVGGIVVVAVVVVAVIAVQYALETADRRAYCVSGFSIPANQRDIAETYRRRGWGEFSAASVSISDIHRLDWDDPSDGDHWYRYAVPEMDIQGRGVGNKCGSADVLPSYLPVNADGD